MSILNHLFNRQRDKEKHDALLARDEALRAKGAGMEQPSRQEALLSLLADQEDKQAATSAMEAKLNQQQLGGSGGPIAAPAPVADIQGGGIYGAQRPQPSMQTSLVNQLLRRAFVGDEADGAMKWFDRDRYYAKKEAEAKSALSAREGAMQEQATAQAEEEAGANWRQIGADRMIPGGSVLNNRSVARLMQQLGGPDKANEVMANVRYAKEMQDALASKAYKDGVLNVPNNTLAFSRFGGPSVRGGMTVKEMVPDPTTGMLVERERYVPESVSAMDGQGGRYGINLFDGSPATDPPIEAALGNAGGGQNNAGGGQWGSNIYAGFDNSQNNAGAQDTGATPSAEHDAKVRALNDHERKLAAVQALVDKMKKGAPTPIPNDLVSRLGADTSNIDPVNVVKDVAQTIGSIHPGNLWWQTASSIPGWLKSIVGDPLAEGSMFEKVPNMFTGSFLGNQAEAEKSIAEQEYIYNLNKTLNTGNKQQ